MTDPRVTHVAELFDQLAATYDQVGVELFGPIGERLVSLLAPLPGESAIDLGCGRGAVTRPLGRAVGPTGHVLAGDISAEMVRATRSTSGALPQVEVRVIDAADPSLPAGSADLITASLVAFFLPDPAAALGAWRALLRPEGRLGITTFGPQDEVWTAVDHLFDTWLPQTVLDARTSGARGPFADDAGVEALFTAAGLKDVTTHHEPLPVAFDDVEAWRRWTMSVGQRQMWGFVPEPERPKLLDRAADLLARARGIDGRIHLVQHVRYTIGR